MTAREQAATLKRVPQRTPHATLYGIGADRGKQGRTGAYAQNSRRRHTRAYAHNGTISCQPQGTAPTTGGRRGGNYR